MNPSCNIELHSHDVLSGRGKKVLEHNTYFRSVVNKLKPEYVMTSRADKPLISKFILKTIKELDPPGRFLTKDKQTKQWIELSDKEALHKTRQALREDAKEIEEQIKNGEIQIETDVVPRFYSNVPTYSCNTDFAVDSNSDHDSCCTDSDPSRLPTISNDHPLPSTNDASIDDASVNCNGLESYLNHFSRSQREFISTVFSKGDEIDEINEMEHQVKAGKDSVNNPDISRGNDVDPMRLSLTLQEVFNFTNDIGMFSRSSVDILDLEKISSYREIEAEDDKAQQFQSSAMSLLDASMM